MVYEAGDDELVVSVLCEDCGMQRAITKDAEGDVRCGWTKPETGEGRVYINRRRDVILYDLFKQAQKRKELHSE